MHAEKRHVPWKFGGGASNSGRRTKSGGSASGGSKAEAPLPTLATSSRTFHPAIRHGRPSALYSPEVEHRHHRRQFFGMASSPPSTLQSFARSRGLLLCIMPVHTSRCHQARIPRVKGRLPCIMIQFFQESLAVPSTRLWEQHGRPRQPRVRPSKLHGHVATTHVGPHN